MVVTEIEKHSIHYIIRGNENLIKCDRCGEIVKEEEAMKNFSKEGSFAYCPKCTKELYPNYKKVSSKAFASPILKNIMREGLARYERLR